MPDILSTRRVCIYYYTDTRKSKRALRPSAGAGPGRADGLTTVILLDVTLSGRGRAASSSDVASAPDRRHDTLCPYRASSIDCRRG